jgi:UDP-2,4-diacetamido-2,4,6-trideoxy-beta-L-altropyranose hydrolase
MAVQGYVVPGGRTLNMKALFRADASLEIGTGHVMRCLTLADALSKAGASCEFICRQHPGHLIDFIRHKGYVTHVLPMVANFEDSIRQPGDASDTGHHHWLGATQEQDAEACAPYIAQHQPDWLIVDHYALDARWENMLAERSRKLMVIDDLADRRHVCDLLLDQTFGRAEDDYRPLVPTDCQLLCGSRYALLRPEFAALRPYSLQRRAQPTFKELLITMGGVDKDNATGQVMQAMGQCNLPPDCRITVVMGATAPWLEAVKKLAQDLPWTTRVLVGVSNMAQLMADSDLAIGAAGATSWERCCLGLPTAMLILAGNQQKAADLLEAACAARPLNSGAELDKELANFIDDILHSKELHSKFITCASKITDGAGCRRVAALLSDQGYE